MRKAVKSQQEAIGRRMGQATADAGFTPTQVAQQLGVYYPTVYRWFRGERTPSGPLMHQFARLVGKSVAFFYAEDEAPDAPAHDLADLLVSWADRLMAGEEPGAAFDRVTGEPAELTPREREQLADAATRMRATLAQAAGDDWERLTDAERRQLLDQIAQMTAGRRPPIAPEPGS